VAPLTGKYSGKAQVKSMRRPAPFAVGQFRTFEQHLVKRISPEALRRVLKH